MQAISESQKKNGIKKQYISWHLKICVNCGNTKVQVYEFGISCELCGTSFYFGKYPPEEHQFCKNPELESEVNSRLKKMNL
jgi:ribosomal protein L37AE/L43A